MKRNRVDEVQFGAPRGTHHRILTTQQNTGMNNNLFVKQNKIILTFLISNVYAFCCRTNNSVSNCFGWHKAKRIC